MSERPVPGAEGVDPQVFHEAYQGVAAWDTGVPQPEVLALVAAGAFDQGPILDVGCGAGANAIALARLALPVVAIDLVPEAIHLARLRADAAGVAAEWLVGNALDLAECVRGRRFPHLLDSGVFHVFGDEDRRHYVHALHAVAAPGARLDVIVFSDQEGGGGGPRRVSREELESAFANGGWSLEAMVETRYALRTRPEGARAWRATFRRD